MNEARAHRCGLYLPGHDVHWIQAKLAARSEVNPETGVREEFVPGKLLEVRQDGILVVETAGVIRRLWNHDPKRFEDQAARNQGEVAFHPRFNLMRTASKHTCLTRVFGEPRTVTLPSWRLLCVADADNPDVRPCPETPPTGDPIDLARMAGGFSISGQEALRWLDRLEQKES